MTSDMGDRLDRYRAERAARPFGDVESISGRVLQPYSIASQEAASNLVDKAERALDAGNVDRARSFVDRACRLPYDDHEETHPVAMAIGLALFDALSHALEHTEPDDARWLDAALDVLATCDDAGRFEMRDALRSIDVDYDLTRSDRSRLRTAVASIPARAELIDLDLSETELGDHVMSILAVCRQYESRVWPTES